MVDDPKNIWKYFKYPINEELPPPPIVILSERLSV